MGRAHKTNHLEGGLVNIMPSYLNPAGFISILGFAIGPPILLFKIK